MNREKNLEIVNKFGDQIELKYGNEYGYYAKNISDLQLQEFCNKANSNAWIHRNRFYLQPEYKKSNTLKVALVNLSKSLKVDLYLLDHTIFIDANTSEWIDIDESTFEIIQNEWRLFMQKNVDSYYEHLMITSVLNEEQMTI